VSPARFFFSPSSGERASERRGERSPKKKKKKTMARPLLFLALLLMLTFTHAAPPCDLSNFQNELSCAAAPPTTTTTTPPLIVRPRTLADVRQAVRSYSPVRAVGAGHSWNAPSFCPGPPTATADNNASAMAAAIVMTTIRPLRIFVDESARTVTADAGVVLADLLGFLSNYASARAPAGYTLPAYPWFVYQTVGGAVATGTHGASVEHGSLSSQLVSIDLVTADGSLRRLSDERDPLLMRAARGSAGRLGIIARVTFRIVPEEPVRRDLRLMTDGEFLGLMRDAQDRWNEAGGAREGTGLPGAAAEPRARRDALVARAKAALPRWALDGQAFWLPERRAFYLVTFTRAGEAGCGGAFNASASASSRDGDAPSSLIMVSAASGPGPSDDNDANQAEIDAACAAFLKNFRPQETTLYNSTLHAYVPGDEPVVPSAGFGADEEMRLGDALRPLVPASASAAAAAGGRRDNGPPGLPYASSLTALRALADRTLVSPLPTEGPNNNSAFETGARGVAWTPSERRIRPSGAYAVRDGTSLSMSGIAVVAGNRTAETASIYLRQPERTLASLRETVYFQHEVAIPLSTAADCLQELVRVAAAARELDAASGGGDDSGNTTSTTGFFTAPLIRFVGPEDALLSYSNLDHGVSVFVNAEDYVSYRADGGEGRDGTGRNRAFKRAMAVLRGSPQCKGSRLHLGKAGWPARGCWRGDEEYGDRWCDFGCSVRAVDPNGKFADASPDRFTWRGARLDDGCCGPSGFLSHKPGCVCRVSHERARESCPPPPYY
jgi:FAD/FMN-containing dehydrogenase